VLKAATMVGCEFCIDIGSALSRAEGVTQEQLRDLPDFERSEAFSLLEKLVLRYAAAARKTSAPGLRA
jgi:AhpD family alkylhydroperoxidase